MSPAADTHHSGEVPGPGFLVVSVVNNVDHIPFLKSPHARARHLHISSNAYKHEHRHEQQTQTRTRTQTQTQTTNTNTNTSTNTNTNTNTHASITADLELKGTRTRVNAVAARNHNKTHVSIFILQKGREKRQCGNCRSKTEGGGSVQPQTWSQEFKQTRTRKHGDKTVTHHSRAVCAPVLLWHRAAAVQT